MGIPMFSAHASPIAMDFGSSSVKLLQIGAGERPSITAAAELSVPDELRTDSNRLFAFYAQSIPNVISQGRFKGKRVVLAVPAAHTFVQHMQLTGNENGSRDSVIQERLCGQMGCLPGNIVVRSVDVGNVHRDGQTQREIICFAMARETVMRYVDLLARCKLKAVGVHTETLAMVRSFDHLSQREGDSEFTTLFVDLGWSGTRVAIAHGRQLAFARYIQMGGRHFDQLIAARLKCDHATARAHRIALDEAITDESGAATSGNGSQAEPGPLSIGDAPRLAPTDAATSTEVDQRTGASPREFVQPVFPGEAPHEAAKVDLSELLDTIADELSMCLRYHRGLFPDRAIDRTVFLGGEARQMWLCQHVVKALRLPAQLGDPAARLSREGTPPTPGLDLGQPQPGWAVACGLCTAPTDL